MKNGILGLLLIASIGTLKAQNFTDNFDLFTVGNGLVSQSSKWEYWRDRGFNIAQQDVNIVDDKAKSGSNSIYLNSTRQFGGPQNIVLPFGSTYEIGNLLLEMWIYVPKDKSARWNLQGQSQLGSVYTLNFEVATTGEYSLIQDNNVIHTGTINQDEWVQLSLNADLTYNKWAFSVNGKKEVAFESIENTLFAMNLFPQAGDAFWIDDVHYKYTPYDYPDVNAALIDATVVGGDMVGDSAFVTATVKNLGVEEINEVQVSYIYNNKIITESLTSISLFTGVDYQINFAKGFEFVAGEKFVEIQISSVNEKAGDDREEDNSLSRKVEFITPGTNKIVLAEYLTDVECKLCPAGIVSDEQMEEEFGVFYQGINIHINDVMETDAAYLKDFKFVFTDQTPFAAINRAQQTNSTPTEVRAGILKELEIPTAAVFDIGAKLDEKEEKLSVSVKFNFKENTGEFWKIACILVEDSVTGTSTDYDQVNGYFRGFAGPMGGWELKDRVVLASDMVYRNVARSMAPGFVGVKLDKVYGNGESYLENYEFMIDPSWNVEHLKIIPVLLEDDGSVNNSGSATLAEAESFGFKDKDGNTDATNFPAGLSLFDVFPNPSSTANIFVKLNAGLSGQLSVVNANGKTVWNKNMIQYNEASVQRINLSGENKGIYLVIMNTENQVFSKTVILK